MRRGKIAAWMLLVLAWPVAQVQAQDALDQSQQTSRQTTRAAAESQRRIDSLSDAARALLEKYRAELWKAQQLQLYVRQLNATIEVQEQRKTELTAQIDRIERTRAELVPMLLRMVDGLEQFVSLDLPFLAAERAQRIKRLREVLADPELPVSEQYRRVFEAYKVEADYGRSLEAWRGPLTDGVQIVDYLRIGRTAWYYLSLDGRAAWQWDRRLERWQPVPSAHVGAIRKGLRVASEQAAPELLALPLAGGGS